MANFCVQCGAPLDTGPFCVKCGADMRRVGTPAQPQAAAPAAPRQGMSALARLGIATIAILFVLGAVGAVGVYYLAHRVGQKIHQAADEVLASSSDSSSGNSGAAASGAASGSAGDVCRFLSKHDVSRAIGVEIVRTNSEANVCTYLAKGTQSEMSAKHLAAMMGSRGADQKSQQMIQNISGGMIKAFATEKHPGQDSSGEVPVFNFSVDPHAAEAQMQLNQKGLSVLGDMQQLSGIGDEAFVSSDGMLMVRKGTNLIRITYITCPCGTEAVKPLAKKIADAL